MKSPLSQCPSHLYYVPEMFDILSLGSDYLVDHVAAGLVPGEQAAAVVLHHRPGVSGSLLYVLQ